MQNHFAWKNSEHKRDLIDFASKTFIPSSICSEYSDFIHFVTNTSFNQSNPFCGRNPFQTNLFVFFFGKFSRFLGQQVGIVYFKKKKFFW